MPEDATFDLLPLQSSWKLGWPRGAALLGTRVIELWRAFASEQSGRGLGVPGQLFDPAEIGGEDIGLGLIRRSRVAGGRAVPERENLPFSSGDRYFLN